MTLYTAVITRGDFAISCLLNAFTFYPYIILSPKRKLQRLQLNFRCHRGLKERHNQTKQRIDAHRNSSSSKIMPNIATLFKATTPKKVTGAEVVFSTFIAEHTLSLLLTILHPHAEISMPTSVRTFFFFFFFYFLRIMKSFACRFPADTK